LRVARFRLHDGDRRHLARVIYRVAVHARFGVRGRARFRSRFHTPTACHRAIAERAPQTAWADTKIVIPSIRAALWTIILSTFHIRMAFLSRVITASSDESFTQTSAGVGPLGQDVVDEELASFHIMVAYKLLRIARLPDACTGVVAILVWVGQQIQVLHNDVIAGPPLCSSIWG